MKPANASRTPILNAIAALGVVFGDIGTSPLYAFKECMHEGTTAADVIGVVSLILWSLIVLISIKYVALVLRADNQGEGGILALLNLTFPEDATPDASRTTALMTALGLLGAALLYGDGVITPAISVLSSVEGLALFSPDFTKLAVPITVGILVALFAIQRKGSGAVGKIFGGVMLLWFTCLGVMGFLRIIEHPQAFIALNPFSGLRYLFLHSRSAIVVLGSVFLAVTGGEALYADLGHFGRGPISAAWNFLVLPALAFNYLGQGALVLTHPEAAQNPFYLLFPKWALLPMVALATAATVIASQALISGVFSLTMQASQMSYLPRIRVLHTSAAASGQIYIPQVNYALAAACIALVVTFQSSSALASAYGVAVTLTMLTTTSLFYFACQRLWRWSRVKAAAVCGVFALIELGFFASNALKIFHGGWLPLFIGALIFYLMTTWKMGRNVVRNQLEKAEPLEKFVDSLHTQGVDRSTPPVKVPGTAVYFTSSKTMTPGALVQNVKHNQIIHERNIVLTIVTDKKPRRSRNSRLEVKSLPLNFFQIIAHYGFMESPKIAELIDCAATHRDFQINPDETSFFLSGQNLVPQKNKGLPRWREVAFLFMSRNAQRTSEFLEMPSGRTLEILWQVDI